MDISVIIPTYKPGDYLWECLLSLENQTFDKSKFEVLLVLNGPKEPYYSDISNRLKKFGLNIHLIYSKNSGVSNARNIGIDKSNGQYIAFIDDDDYISAMYLAELFDNAAPNCVSISNALYFDDKSGKQQSSRLERLFQKYHNSPQKISLFQVRSYFNGPCMKLFSKNIISNRRFDPNFRNGEDNLYMFLISDAIKEVKFTSPNAIYYRRIRENSAMTSQKPVSEITINAFKLMSQYMKYLYKNGFKYNLPFVLSRFMGEFKSIILSLR